MKSKVKFLIIGSAGFFLVLVGLFVFVKWWVLGSYIKEVTLQKNIFITSEWKEINTRNLVKIDKDINYISIVLEPPYETFASSEGIKIPSGEVINPEIKLVDEDGKEYSFAYSGARLYGNNEYANYKYYGDFPVDKEYEKLLIRSDSQIKAREIQWSGYNTEDLK